VLADPLRNEMEEAATNQDFERAANLRDRLDAVASFHGSGGEAVSAQRSERTVDVVGVSVAGPNATVARLHSEGGKLVDRERHLMNAPEGDHHAGTVLASFVSQYYAERVLPDEILFSDAPDDEELEAWLAAEGVEINVPGTGRQAKLVELALKNARRSDPAALRDEQGALADALSLDAPPKRIEGFDVSHAQGKAVVGSNVVFVDGSPETDHYRRKKLDERNDDYENMRTLVRWRAQRAIEGRDDRPDPDLLLIDGGEGQLSAAGDALDSTGWDVPAIALAKDEERVVTPTGTFDCPEDAPHLHLLQRVRDEAHRFAVQYHQTLRDEVSTVLDDVDGIGPKTRRALLRRFGSVEGIRNASLGELQSVEGVGEKTAEQVTRRL
jgi:excinuclease ABC subunit C